MILAKRQNLWVLLEFDNTKAKELFRDKRCGVLFSLLLQASHDSHPEGRIAWVDVEGIPFKFWSGKTFKKIATKWGELLDVDDHDEMMNSPDLGLPYWSGEYNGASEVYGLNRGGYPYCLVSRHNDVEIKWLLMGIIFSHVSNQWAGEVVMMGDFNEVLKRFLLVEVHILGATNPLLKMSRFLSDHRPILLREASFDYGPTPFRFFHFWFDVDGFDKFVTDSWKDAPGDGIKSMRNFVNAHIDMPFPNSLSTDQQKDLECMVSKEEVKRAVWDCGTDKSPAQFMSMESYRRNPLLQGLKQGSEEVYRIKVSTNFDNIRKSRWLRKNIVLVELDYLMFSLCGMGTLLSYQTRFSKQTATATATATATSTATATATATDLNIRIKSHVI
ncbi:RNA-directed DNA polymerase, eukaryota [Tanacetum coccineum]